MPWAQAHMQHCLRHRKALFLLVFTTSIVRPGIDLKREEEPGREEYRDRFCSHPSHVGVNKGREAASMDSKLGKNGKGQNCFFFLAWPWKSMRAEDEKQRN